MLVRWTQVQKLHDKQKWNWGSWFNLMQPRSLFLTTHQALWKHSCANVVSTQSSYISGGYISDALAEKKKYCLHLRLATWFQTVGEPELSLNRRKYFLPCQSNQIKDWANNTFFAKFSEPFYCVIWKKCAESYRSLMSLCFLILTLITWVCTLYSLVLSACLGSSLTMLTKCFLFWASVIKDSKLCVQSSPSSCKSYSLDSVLSPAHWQHRVYWNCNSLITDLHQSSFSQYETQLVSTQQRLSKKVIF